MVPGNGLLYHRRDYRLAYFPPSPLRAPVVVGLASRSIGFQVPVCDSGRGWYNELGSPVFTGCRCHCSSGNTSSRP